MREANYKWSTNFILEKVIGWTFKGRKKSKGICIYYIVILGYSYGSDRKRDEIF